MTGDERVVLDHWLDLYRDTLLLKNTPRSTAVVDEPYRRRAAPTEVEAY